MKPGQMKNVEHPEQSTATGIQNAHQVASGSRQTPETAQLSGNPNRLRPAPQEAGEHGHSEVWRDGVMENQTENKTASLKTAYATRKKIFG